MMKVDIRQIDLKDMDAVFSLYGDVFGKDKLGMWKQRWEWEFLKNPRNDLALSRMWVAVRQDGKILGYIGSFPMLLKIGTTDILTSSSGDLMVFADGRRQGLGQRLSKAYRDSETVLATDGFGYQPVTGRIYRRLGYKPVYCEPIYVRPFDLQSIFQFLIDSERIPTILSKGLLSLLTQSVCIIFNKFLCVVNRATRPNISKDLVIEEVKQVGPEFDVLWKNISHDFPVIFVRDSKFVKWRFMDDPVSQHTLLSARDSDGNLCGYLDFCISTRRKMPTGRIMDIFCKPSSADIIDSLLGKALDILQNKKVALVSCLGMHPDIRKRVKKVLYLRVRSVEIPALLYCTGEERIENLVYNENMWHLTSADGDEGFAP